LNSAVLFF